MFAGLSIPTRFQNTNQNAKLGFMLNFKFTLPKCAIKNTRSPYEEVCAAQLQDYLKFYSYQLMHFFIQLCISLLSYIKIT